MLVRPKKFCFQKMKLFAKGRKREQALTRSITSAIAVIDLVKLSENQNMCTPQRGKRTPNSENIIWNQKSREIPPGYLKSGDQHVTKNYPEGAEERISPATRSYTTL